MGNLPNNREYRVKLTEVSDKLSWKTTTLGEVITLQRGFDLPEAQREPGLHPIVASTGVVGTHAHAMVKGPGVVIGRSGSLGGGQYIKSHFWPLNTTLWVKDFKNNNPHFCYFLLKSLNLAQFNVGSGVPTLNRNHIHHLAVSIPSDVTEQRRIAHVLGTLDDKIENNRKTAKTLESMAQAIFKSWFVDFDPVRAKMAGESRESICKRLKITPEILDLFPDRLVDSELGEIPEGWKIGSFADYADIVGGGTPSTKNPDYWFSGIHSWATPKDLSNLSLPVLLATENKITDAGLQKISSRLLPVGTVLLSSRAPIGYLAITQIPLAINQGFIALKSYNCDDNVFLMFLIRHNLDKIIGRANGSIFLEICKTKFKPIQIVSPSQAVLRHFANLAGPLFACIVSLERLSRELTIQRDTMLPKLISGEIRVPDAEHLVETSEA